MTTLTAVLACGAVATIGLGASIAVFPARSLALPTRVASVFGLGGSAVIFASTLLVLLGFFGPVELSLVLVPVAASSWFVGLRRSTLAEHVAALREEVRADPLVTLVFLVVLVAAVAWAAVAVLPSAGGWRYWADGLELADVGQIPGFTAQWGAALEPAVSKLGGNAFLGALSFVFSAHPFTGMAVALWLSAVGYAAGLFALAYELGLRWTAAVVALIGVAAPSFPAGVVLNSEISHKLAFYQHEDLGRMLAACGAAIVLARGRDGPSHAQIVAGACVLAAAGLTHLIPVVAFAVFIGGVLLARIAFGPARRQVALAGALAAGTTVLLVIAPLALARGEVGFSGATDPDRYTLVEGRYDPTARMKGLSLAPRPKSDARWYQAPATTARLAAEASVGRSLGRGSALLVAVVVLAFAAVVFAFGTLDHRCLAAGALLMWAGLLGAGLFFSFRYGLWAQGTFGERRLFEYASLPLILIGAAALQVVAERLEGRRSLAGPALGVAAALAALLLSLRSLGVSDEQGTMRYIAAAATTPCDTRLLVDHVTRGSFQALAGRISVTEGLVPFLRPELVNEVVALREESRTFFKSPVDAPRLLAREEVDFVLTTRPDKLEIADSLHFVREVDGVSVYEVDRADGDGRLPRPTASPGYECLTSPSQ